MKRRQRREALLLIAQGGITDGIRRCQHFVPPYRCTDPGSGKIRGGDGTGTHNAWCEACIAQEALR